MRIWIDHRKGYGDRVVTQTRNPNTKKWNNPKKSTYSPIILLVKERQKDGRDFVVPKHITGRMDETVEDLIAVKNKYKLNEDQQHMLKGLIVAKNAQKYVKYTIKESEPIDLFGDPEAVDKLKKLSEEQETAKEREKEVIDEAFNLSYREMKAQGKI
jgi:hypothetical protein